jgi:type IV pilus assembly protein PilC
MHFAKRLSMMMRSGMPIAQGISMLGSQAHSGSTAYVFQELTAHVSAGQPLSSALKKFEHIFGEFCISIVKVGETIGTLPENLNYLAEELKKARDLKRKVTGALVYPAIIVLATFGIATFLTVYIFPKITPIFASLKSELPLSTKILVALSSFLISNGGWVIFWLIAFSVTLFALLRWKPFRYWFDHFVLTLPLFGVMMQYYNVTNTTRTFGLLLKSEVRVAHAFEILAESTKNLAYREALERAGVQVVKGRKISSQFEGNKRLFPPIIAQMIAVGEQTGNLSGSLMYCSEMYEEELNDFTRNLTTIIEPVLMIVMGLIVGFVAISIITPIYGLTQYIHN